MSAVNIPTIYTGWRLSDNSPIGTFAFEYGGYQYFFLEQGGSGSLGSGDGNIHALKTADGTTWSELDAGGVHTISAAGGAVSTVARDGDTVLVMSMRRHNPGGGLVIDGPTIQTFDLLTETWGAAVNLSLTTGFVYAGASWQAIQLVTRGPGDYVLYYSGPRQTIGGSTYGRAWCVDFDGSTFGTPAELPGQTGNTRNYVPLSAACSFGGVMTFLAGSNGSVFSLGMLRDGTFGTAVVITTDDASISSTAGTASQLITHHTGPAEMLRFAMTVYESDGSISLVMFSAIAALNPTWDTEVIANGDYGGVQTIYPDNSLFIPQSIALANICCDLVLTWVQSDNEDFGPVHIYAAQRVAGTWSTPASLLSVPAELPDGGGFSATKATQVYMWPMTDYAGLVAIWTGEGGLVGGVSNYGNNVAQFTAIEGGTPAPPVTTLSNIAF